MMLLAYLALAAAPPEDRLPPAQVLPPPTGEEQSVLSTVNALLATLSTGDFAAMLRWVFSDGRVTATGTRANSSGLRQESWAQFAQRITPGAAFQETISDAAIEIDGAALVWAPFVVRVNGKVANCGFDHFDLVRDQGQWKVMNLTFSSRTEGCPAQ